MCQGTMQPFCRVGSVHPGRAETACRRCRHGECKRNCPSSLEFWPGVAQVTQITLLAQPATVEYICSSPGPHWFGAHLRALPSLLATLLSLLTPHRLSFPAAISPCLPPSLFTPPPSLPALPLSLLAHHCLSLPPTISPCCPPSLLACHRL